MSDPARIQRVALALAEMEEAAEQGKKVRLPVIQRADAAGLVNFMHAQLDDAIERREEQIGARIACKRGCSACCASPVLISEGEAVAIAEWLREPANAGVRARFEAAYPQWRDRLGDLVGRADSLSREETPVWLEQVQRRQAMCAFNHEGACSVYPVRPAICRKTHALDTAANCANLEVPVQYFQHPETEQLYEQQMPLRFALHKVLRPGARPELLSFSVHRALGGGAAAGRNDPCPCGSGKKYKKCCAA